MAKIEFRFEKHEAELGRVYSINVKPLFTRESKFLGFVYPDVGKVMLLKNLPKIIQEEAESHVISRFGMLELYELEVHDEKG